MNMQPINQTIHEVMFWYGADAKAARFFDLYLEEWENMMGYRI